MPSEQGASFKQLRQQTCKSPSRTQAIILNETCKPRILIGPSCNWQQPTRRCDIRPPILQLLMLPKRLRTSKCKIPRWASCTVLSAESANGTLLRLQSACRHRLPAGMLLVQGTLALSSCSLIQESYSGCSGAQNMRISQNRGPLGFVKVHEPLKVILVLCAGHASHRFEERRQRATSFRQNGIVRGSS